MCALVVTVDKPHMVLQQCEDDTLMMIYIRTFKEQDFIILLNSALTCYL